MISAQGHAARAFQRKKFIIITFRPIAYLLLVLTALRFILGLLVQETKPLMFLTALIILVLSGGLIGLAYSTYKKFKSRKED